MWVVLLIPTVISFLLLGAHFLRDGNVALVVVSLMVPLILLIRRCWVTRAVQLILMIAAIEWVRTAIVLAEDRLAAGDPWKRMAAILGGVALWTVCSAFLLESPPVRRRYRSEMIESDHQQ